MTIQPVLTHPNDALRTPSMQITLDEMHSSSFKILIADLKETMALERGVGIAAPQIGVHKRLIVVETIDGPQAFINPRIVKKSIRKMDSEEGCLSVPGVFGIIRRHRAIVINAHNEQGDPITIRTHHFPAIVFQHEIDHLDGILFIDKMIRASTHSRM